MSKLKYKINDQIRKLKYLLNVSTNDIVERVEKQGISKSTFYRDANYPMDSPASIPTDRLEIYARLFECTTDELKNYSVDNVPSIREQLGDKLDIKTGLS